MRLAPVRSSAVVSDKLKFVAGSRNRLNSERDKLKFVGLFKGDFNHGTYHTT